MEMSREDPYIHVRWLREAHISKPLSGRRVLGAYGGVTAVQAFVRLPISIKDDIKAGKSQPEALKQRERIKVCLGYAREDPCYIAERIICHAFDCERRPRRWWTITLCFLINQHENPYDAARGERFTIHKVNNIKAKKDFSCVPQPEPGKTDESASADCDSAQKQKRTNRS